MNVTRTPIIAGNWKMHKTAAETGTFFNELKTGLSENDQRKKMPEVVVAPPFTALHPARTMIQDTPVKLGAQNCHQAENGAFTGEISIPMLKEADVKYVIIGHSERRQMFGETDEMVNKKAKALLGADLTPIICCGETLEQRNTGQTDAHIESQITKAFEGISADDAAKSVIAYEPVWAIGTGKTCDSQEANRVVRHIRNVVETIEGEEAASKVRILYGGSVKPGNIEELMSTSDIDGALVGGAALKAGDFAGIIKGCMNVKD